ncbi:MAG: 5-formyltetrahydrofolate cyclo-ligase, partial [Alphaproteobacteria bacterium]
MALARRAALARSDQGHGPHSLGQIGLGFLDLRPCEISAYVATGSELDLKPLLQVLTRAGHRLCLPVVPGPARPLLFRRWQIGDPLEDGAMNIPAPLARAAVVIPHIVLVPLLAIDRAGYR